MAVTADQNALFSLLPRSGKAKMTCHAGYTHFLFSGIDMVENKCVGVSIIPTLNTFSPMLFYQCKFSCPVAGIFAGVANFARVLTMSGIDIHFIFDQKEDILCHATGF